MYDEGLLGYPRWDMLSIITTIIVQLYENSGSFPVLTQRAIPTNQISKGRLLCAPKPSTLPIGWDAIAE